MNKKLWVFVLMITLLVTAGCGVLAPEPTVTPTETVTATATLPPTATATSVPPTATPEPTFTPTPPAGNAGYLDSLIFINTFYEESVEVFATNMRYNNTLTISDSEDNYWAIGIFLSGDGSRLAFANFGETEDDYSIWVREITSGNLWQILDAEDLYDEIDFMSLSPDGHYMLYTDTHPDGGERDIYRVDVDSGDIVNLTNGHKWDSAPDWSPDGEQIVFVSDRPTYGESISDQIYTMNKNGEHVTSLTSTEIWENSVPVWSPDGAKIAFIRWSFLVQDSDHGPAGLWVMDADGSNAHVIVKMEINPYLPPAWSPDGNYIAFSSGLGSSSILYTAKSDGSESPELLSDMTGVHTTISWSPDSEALLFTLDGEILEVYFVLKDGAGLTLVLDAASGAVWIDPAWYLDE